MRSLLLVENFDFRPSNQYILVRVIPSCFGLCQVSLLSRCSQRDMASSSRGSFNSSKFFLFFHGGLHLARKHVTDDTYDICHSLIFRAQVLRQVVAGILGTAGKCGTARDVIYPLWDSTAAVTLTRGRVCNLLLLLVHCSAVTLGLPSVTRGRVCLLSGFCQYQSIVSRYVHKVFTLSVFDIVQGYIYTHNIYKASFSPGSVKQIIP
jgi:hypothetical protein